MAVAPYISRHQIFEDFDAALLLRRQGNPLNGSRLNINERRCRKRTSPIYAAKDLHKFGGPGGWNDPDYLLLGYLSNWKGKTVPTPLTPDEQYSHVALWSLLAAPLIFSGDMTRLDDFTLGLLCNDEMIDVDQDPGPTRPSGRQG